MNRRLWQHHQARRCWLQLVSHPGLQSHSLYLCPPQVLWSQSPVIAFLHLLFTLAERFLWRQFLYLSSCFRRHHPDLAHKTLQKSICQFTRPFIKSCWSPAAPSRWAQYSAPEDSVWSLYFSVNFATFAPYSANMALCQWFETWNSIIMGFSKTMRFSKSCLMSAALLRTDRPLWKFHGLAWKGLISIWSFLLVVFRRSIEFWAELCFSAETNNSFNSILVSSFWPQAVHRQKFSEVWHQHTDHTSNLRLCHRSEWFALPSCFFCVSSCHLSLDYTESLGGCSSLWTWNCHMLLPYLSSCSKISFYERCLPRASICRNRFQFYCRRS